MKKWILGQMVFAAICFLACEETSQAPEMESSSTSVSSSSFSSEVDLSSSEESSDANSSSSGVNVVSSSSYSVLESGKYYNPNISYGELVDERDGQVYRTVAIGSEDSTQIWMAENLNFDYDVQTASGKPTSFCYQDSVEYCAKLGRYYTWAAAMDSAALFSEDGKECGLESKECAPKDTVRGVCPKGWHLPSSPEFHRLTAYAYSNGRYVESWKTGRLLKSKVGWKSTYNQAYDKTIERNGYDSFGFGAIPAGGCVPECQNIGFSAFFWTSTKGTLTPERNAFRVALYNYHDWYDETWVFDYFADNYAHSVRCVQDAD